MPTSEVSVSPDNTEHNKPDDEMSCDLVTSGNKDITMPNTSLVNDLEHQETSNIIPVDEQNMQPADNGITEVDSSFKPTSVVSDDQNVENAKMELDGVDKETKHHDDKDCNTGASSSAESACIETGNIDITSTSTSVIANSCLLATESDVVVINDMDESVVIKKEEDFEIQYNTMEFRDVESYLQEVTNGYQQCQSHAQEMLEKNIVCLSCQCLICALCLCDKHNRHHIVSITKLRECKTIRSLLEEDVSVLQLLQKGLMERFSERQNLKKQIETSSNVLLEKVDEAFEEFMKIVQEKKKEIRTHILDFESRSVQDLNKELEKIRSIEKSATLMIKRVMVFFTEIDTRDTQELPHKLKDVILMCQSLSQTEDQKERYLPERKFSKLLPSLSAVSKICQTIHPEATKVVWSKIPSEKQDCALKGPKNTGQKDIEPHKLTENHQKSPNHHHHHNHHHHNHHHVIVDNHHTSQAKYKSISKDTDSSKSDSKSKSNSKPVDKLPKKKMDKHKAHPVQARCKSLSKVTDSSKSNSKSHSRSDLKPSKSNKRTSSDCSTAEENSRKRFKCRKLNLKKSACPGTKVSSSSLFSESLPFLNGLMSTSTTRKTYNSINAADKSLIDMALDLGDNHKVNNVRQKTNDAQSENPKRQGIVSSVSSPSKDDDILPKLQHYRIRSASASSDESIKVASLRSSTRASSSRSPVKRAKASPATSSSRSPVKRVKASPARSKSTVHRSRSPVSSSARLASNSSHESIPVLSPKRQQMSRSPTFSNKSVPSGSKSPQKPGSSQSSMDSTASKSSPVKQNLSSIEKMSGSTETKEADSSTDYDLDENGLPKLKLINFNVMEMTAGKAVIIRGPRSITMIGRVENVARLKDTNQFNVKWFSGELGVDTEFEIMEGWQKKSDCAHAGCVIGHFKYDHKESMSSQLITELMIASKQTPFSVRQKSEDQPVSSSKDSNLNNLSSSSADKDGRPYHSLSVKGRGRGRRGRYPK